MRKYPICIQHELMDCGIACISMITRYYKCPYSIPELKKKCIPTREGISLKRISETLEDIGFNTVGGKISLDTLQKAQLPIILHWEQRHFVVLYKIQSTRKGKIFWIGDPACGLIKYNQKEFLEKWISTRQSETDRGIALLILPNKLQKASSKGTNKSNLTSVLSPYIIQYKTFFIQLAIGFGLLGCIQLAFPYFTSSIVDIGISSKDIHFITLILLGQLVLLLSSTCVRMINNWILLHISTRINLSLVSDFLLKLMKLPMSFFDVRMTGDIVERIADHKKIENFIVSQLLTLIYVCFTGIIFCIVLCSYNPPIFFIYIIGSSLYICWLLAFLRKRKKLNYEVFQANAITNNVTYQLVNGMQEAKLQGCTQRRRWEWEDARTRQFEVNVRLLKMNQVQEIGSFFINESTNLTITFMSVSAVINGHITLGMMLAIQYIIGQLSAPISQLISMIYSIQDVCISLERINEIKQKEDENKDCTIKVDFHKKQSPIYIKDLSFHYEGSYKDVLKHISLNIQPHTTLAIVGSSGSGKTTLLKLLLQYYTNYEGNILVENIDLRKIHRDDWRNACSVVMQDSYIFSESIARNIATTDENIDSARLAHAVDIANIRDFIESLPLKYDTRIGLEGRSLSQGQKQRILLARAIYKNGEYFFLDEATNSLDAINEKQILDKLEQHLKGKTTIIVAHRLSTVRNADNIIVLEHGEIVESGTHTELISRKGAYYQLIKNQLELGI